MCSRESWHSHIHREQLISRVWPKSLMLLKYKCYHVAVEYRERKESCIANQLHFHYYIFLRRKVAMFFPPPLFHSFPVHYVENILDKI